MKHNVGLTSDHTSDKGASLSMRHKPRVSKEQSVRGNGGISVRATCNASTFATYHGVFWVRGESPVAQVTKEVPQTMRCHFQDSRLSNIISLWSIRGLNFKSWPKEGLQKYLFQYRIPNAWDQKFQPNARRAVIEGVRGRLQT